MNKLEQHPGEPAALPARMPAHHAVKHAAYPQGWNACLDEIAKLGPLYTHADPGEVERLRGAVNEWETKWKQEAAQVGLLRAQLAERDALLARVVNSGALSSEQHEELEADCCAAVDVVHQIKRQAFREHLDKCAALSASAEPGAPKGCGKWKVVFEQGSYGKCGDPSPYPTDNGNPAFCPDCKSSAAT